MVDLKCKKIDCIHNSNCNCYARYINVDKQTYCESFRHSHREKQTAEVSDEIVQPIVRPSVEVECKANCVFNSDGTCKANGITIYCDNNDPECSTFLPK